MERRTVEEGIAKPEQARELAIQRLKMKQDFKGIAAGGVLVVALCFLIWQFGDDSFPWPVWVAFGLLVVLVVQGWKAYGPSNRITEADVQREIERASRHAPGPKASMMRLWNSLSSSGEMK